MLRFTALSVAAFVISPQLHAAPAPSAVESAFRGADRYSRTFRPTNLYRWGSYIPNSAVCDVFPGTNRTRVGCSVLVEAEVDSCPSEKRIFDRLVFRVVATVEGRIIGSSHDGGEDSTAAACDY